MSDCELSLRGRAFSTVLTSLVGSVVTSISNGPVVAFFIGWICWLAAVRLMLVSFAGLLVTICGPRFGMRQPFLYALPTVTPQDEEIVLTTIVTTGRNGKGTGNADDLGAQIDMSSTSFGQLAKPPAVLPATGDGAVDSGVNFAEGKTSANGINMDTLPDNVDARVNRFMSLTERNRNVTILGSFGWIYSFIYAPIIQVLWVIANWSKAPSFLLFARAVGVSVTALSYTIDTRARYGAAFGKKCGNEKVVPRLMNLYSATMNMLLSTIVVLLLIRALDRSLNSDFDSGDRAIAPIYVLFSCVWACGSLKFIWPSDEGWNGISLGTLRTCNGSIPETLKKILFGLFIGAFAGTVVAFPSFVLWQIATVQDWAQNNGFPSDDYTDTTGQLPLGEWLECTTDSWWEKLVQVLP